MTEYTPEDEFAYGEFDVVEDVEPVSAFEAVDYNDVPRQDDTLEGLGAPGDAPRTPEQAIATARNMSKNRSFVGVGMCLRTVRSYYGVNAKYLDASASWNAAAHKRRVLSGNDVPRGVPVYWTGGSGGHGHIAISVGGGMCLSTDWKEPGRIDYARIDEITSRWGLRFEGWAWETNDVICWKPPQPVGIVALRNLKPGHRHADVKAVKRQLARKGYKGFILSSDKFGAGTRRAYKKFQQHLGYNGTDADGVPGELSLKKLGFRVR